MHVALCVGGLLLLLLEAGHHLSQDAPRHVPGSLGAGGGVGVGGVLLTSSPSSSCRSPSSTGPSPLRRSSFGHLLELLGDFLQRAVDLELGPLAVRLLAEGTLVGTVGAPRPAAVPVGRDAALAKAVATRRRHRVVEHLQADGAGELVLGQEGGR